MTRTRVPLSNRRSNHTETLTVGGHTFEACVGFDHEGRPRELFLNGTKEGSHFATMLADAATSISIALQYGVPPAALAKSVGRAPNLATAPGSLAQLGVSTKPASPIGAALDLLCRLEPPELHGAYRGIGAWDHR